MVWDLRRALLKKEEVESARLMDFEFRLRARSLRTLGEALGLHSAELARRSVVESDAAILQALSDEGRGSVETLAATLAECREAVRRELIAERGDPTPNRLA
ncbi:hypothetical protein [Sphingomonas sp.]|uniref:hypothetical protein n=1 Tax=Sphingomonas sp. TaxID=28214 RepID=UPI001B0C753D|nr:hypothetical protein [Sphingomonas sp.]MBO9711381.1 hypothetical protein [Sphingomonas sp.]